QVQEAAAGGNPGRRVSPRGREIRLTGVPIRDRVGRVLVPPDRGARPVRPLPAPCPETTVHSDNPTPRPLARRPLPGLVLDDDQDTADGTVRLIQRWGHDARVSDGATDTLAVARDFRPDILVADIVPCWEDGPRLMEQLRDCLRPARLGLIALTTQADDATRRRCAQMKIGRASCRERE